VYGAVDPNPVNRGRAKRVLAKAGIVCEQVDSEGIVRECDHLIRGFRKHVTTGFPYVTVKIAMSLDGKICDDYGNARWISSEKSRRMTGRLREKVDAIMVGAETVRKDNPSLLSHGKRNDDLMRVVVTRSGKLPEGAQIFTDGAPNETRVIRVGKDARDLKDVLRQLGKAGVMHVLCEGGLALARSLADAGLVDEWISILAPIVIGSRPITRALRLKQAGCVEQGGDMEGLFRCSRA
ncbi:MAG: dihydrofolate reductase family protein, partial [bacterium]|nr:dihydrofolate reductase family protein [Candidatus Colisoma equi]